MSLRSRASGRFLSALVLLVFALTSAVWAQEAPTPKVDVFAGYSWLNPGLQLNGVKLNSDAKGFAIAQQPLRTIEAGGTTSFTILFRPPAKGTYDTIVTITSTDPKNPAFSFYVSATGTE